MAAYSENDPNWEEEGVKPDFYRFVFTQKGSAWLKMGGKEYVSEPGQLYILPAGVKQTYGTLGEESFGRYWCHFRANLGDMQLLEVLKLPVYVSVDDEDFVKSLYIKMITALKERTLTSGLRLKAALLELLSYYLDRCDFVKSAGGDREDLSKLDNVLQYIENHLDSPIHIEELARLAYLHPNYFIEFFKSMVGSPPIQYVNQRRLERAKHLLEHSDEHVACIAKQVGMQNHYLSRMFKIYTGLTPSRYRKIYRNTYMDKTSPDKRMASLPAGNEVGGG
ncbi:AraC family transcriptional regulator [Paenibacillus abyssi]|uniref:AraC family transcriptional regulator n=1 Tax=Paenibacillus abyssi TaxID=1340531 RepID=A0A917LH70_9BACL|nr:AraC family transcriptional regulator [Paenibacillus abyssi]